MIVSTLQQQIESSALAAQDKTQKIQSLQQLLADANSKSDKLLLQLKESEEEVTNLQEDLSTVDKKLKAERQD